jgi:mannosyl-oligosaccharide alpha-1,3-glucosidase
VDYSDRKVVIITDPHIKMDDEYRVYKKGKDLDLKPDRENPEIFNNIYIKSKLMIPFEGSSWPGNCVWIDFMNIGAHKFWKSLYKYEFFKGTD